MANTNSSDFVPIVVPEALGATLMPMPQPMPSGASTLPANSPRGKVRAPPNTAAASPNNRPGNSSSATLPMASRQAPASARGARPQTGLKPGLPRQPLNSARSNIPVSSATSSVTSPRQRAQQQSVMKQHQLFLLQQRLLERQQHLAYGCSVGSSIGGASVGLSVQSGDGSPRLSATEILARATSQERLLSAQTASPRGAGPSTATFKGRRLGTSSSEGALAAAGLLKPKMSPRLGLCSSTLDLRTVEEARACGDLVESSSRLMTEEEERRLKLKGERERFLLAQKAAKDRDKFFQSHEKLAKEASRDKLTADMQDEKDRVSEEAKRRRLWDIEERQRQAELRRWAREQKLDKEDPIIVSPRLSPRGSSLDPSRRDLGKEAERKMREKSEKEIVRLRAREAAKRAHDARLKKQEEVHADWLVRQQRLEAAKEDKRRQEEIKRSKVREQREIQAENRAILKKGLTDQQKQQEIREYRRREQDKMRRQQEQERLQTMSLQVKGQKERILRDAKELRRQEEEIAKKKALFTKAAWEQEVATAAEEKERKEEEAKIRRLLDVEQREVRAEYEHLEREQRKLAEDGDRTAVYFVPPAPKARLMARLSTRSLSPSFFGVGGS